MDFSLPAKPFLKRHFDLSKMSGQEKFLAVGASIATGDTDHVVTTHEVKLNWSKTLLGIGYHSSHYHRAQLEGWVQALGKGSFLVTERGLAYLGNLSKPALLESGGSGSPKLYIFLPKKTHSFDKFLRTVLSSAVLEVGVADSYVDETIFDNILDSIPEQVKVRLLYGHSTSSSFATRLKRFKIEYTKFEAKSYGQLHDRFIMVDDRGYIIGPSLKNAVENKPALVVELGKTDTKSLRDFFNTLWAQAS